jgi:hypothetical protein
MRKLFVAILSVAGLAATPAIASARPPQRIVEMDHMRHGVDRHDVRQTRFIKEHVNDTLARLNINLERAFRRGTISPRELRNLRTEIRGVRAELRRSLRFDGQIGRREARSLQQRLNELEQRVAVAAVTRGNRVAWR